MARKLSIVLLCLVAVLLVGSHAETTWTITKTPTPAPAPSPSPSPAPTPSIMIHDQGQGQGQGQDQDQDGTTEGSLQPQDCAPRCEVRCSKTHHKKPCLFFCQKCCATCLCVPPGTYGNKEVCPCYNNWKTKEGGPKCP